jgi:hypothetical protein
MEHTEIIHLIDLFDEFYLFDQKEQTTSPVTTSTTVEQVKTENVEVHSTSPVESAQPITLTYAEPIIEPPVPSSPIQYAGANKRLFAFIYNDKINKNDERANVELISNLIKNALKWTMDDIAIIRLSKNEDLKIARVIEQLKVNKVIIWGMDDGFEDDIKQKGIHEVHSYLQSKVLITHPVSDYHQNNRAKQSLWQSIQLLLS